jgi:shikimate dehydrogenase
MDTFGLIGNPLTHSFSKRYFTDKFKSEHIQAVYELFTLDSIEQLPGLIDQIKNLKGLSVTIPFKSEVIPYLSNMDTVAKRIGAVNTIKINRQHDKTELVGFNTDVYGFEKTLNPYLSSCDSTKALVLGTGGASKAVQFVLNKKEIPYTLVSRNPSSPEIIAYGSITPDIIKDHLLLINTTPVGMYPYIDEAPEIPYNQLGNKHILIDLIYNPAESLFLKNGKVSGASTVNGIQMLFKQAEKAWKIWNRR